MKPKYHVCSFCGLVYFLDPLLDKLECVSCSDSLEEIVGADDE